MSKQFDWIDRDETVCTGSLNAAYDSGYFGVMMGFIFNDNPYPAGSALAHEWQRGYEDRRRELAE